MKTSVSYTPLSYAQLFFVVFLSTAASFCFPQDDLLSALSAALLAPEPATPTTILPGLDYAYYELDNSLESTMPVKEGVVEAFDLSLRQQNANFAIRYSGYISIPHQSTYRFQIATPDNVRLQLGGETILTFNPMVDSAPKESDNLSLQPGYYALRVDYSRGAEMQEPVLVISWSSGQMDQQEIANTYLYRDAPSDQPDLTPTTSPSASPSATPTVTSMAGGSTTILPTYTPTSPVTSTVTSSPATTSTSTPTSTPTATLLPSKLLPTSTPTLLVPTTTATSTPVAALGDPSKQLYLPSVQLPVSEEASVYFVGLTSGSRVVSPFEVTMGAANFRIEPAGLLRASAGHFHLMVDVPCIQPGQPIPSDNHHLHFSDGAKSVTLELASGLHTLCLQAGNGVHIALDVTQEITVMVEERSIDPAVRFVAPASGTVLNGIVNLEMAAENFVIEPAGASLPGHGHFHVIVNSPCVTPGNTIPRDAVHNHFGLGQHSAYLELEPGVHQLCLQAGDGFHTALDLTQQVTITVQAGR
ncbi:MAG: DUF4399 domain-containing protein [Chloroflexota bacterium]